MRNRPVEMSELRLAHHEKMTARWKAGEFDDIYGKYTAKGVLMNPPPKEYVELGPRRHQRDSGVPPTQGLRLATSDRSPE